MIRRRILAAASAAGMVAAAGLMATVLPGTASAAGSGCSVTYTVQNQWSGGFGASVSITNLGAPVSGWTLGFDFPAAGQSVTQGWNATWAQSGKSVTAASLSWNGSLATNGSTAIGFNGAWSSTNPVP
ncbi:cellulose binding domain-containing protein, partial [Actinacidiphila bryophytorum]